MGCLKLSYYEAGEAMGKTAFFSGGRLEKKGSALKNCYNYYPFGLTFNSYQRSYSKANNYKYNGVELNPTTQIYETLFRGYDPALGRFMQIDPLADFMPGINPYSFGFNNPISFSDPTGLAPQWWAKLMAGLDRIGNILKGDFNKPGRYDKNGTTAGTGNGRRRNNSGGSSNSNSTTPTNSYAEVSGIDMPSSSFAEFNAPLSTPKEMNPFERKQPTLRMNKDEDEIIVDANTRIRMNFSPFGGNSSVVNNTRQLNNFLNPIADFLRDNPEMAITIVVNTQLTQAQLNQIININGGTNNATTRQLLSQRGQAIQRALLGLGTDQRQVVFMFNNGSNTNRVDLRFRER